MSLNEKSFPGESENERVSRMARRHSKFGVMAERLSLESELPVRVDQVELLLEIIEDELKSNVSLLLQIRPNILITSRTIIKALTLEGKMTTKG